MRRKAHRVPQADLKQLWAREQGQETGPGTEGLTASHTRGSGSWRRDLSLCPINEEENETLGPFLAQTQMGQ